MRKNYAKQVISFENDEHFNVNFPHLHKVSTIPHLGVSSQNTASAEISLTSQNTHFKRYIVSNYEKG